MHMHCDLRFPRGQLWHLLLSLQLQALDCVKLGTQLSGRHAPKLLSSEEIRSPHEPVAQPCSLLIGPSQAMLGLFSSLMLQLCLGAVDNLLLQRCSIAHVLSENSGIAASTDESLTAFFYSSRSLIVDISRIDHALRLQFQSYRRL